MGESLLAQADRRWPRLAVAVAVAFALVNVAALAALWLNLSRSPSAAELRQAADLETAARWRTWPAGRIFPERLGYGVVDDTEYAMRVGISPDTICAHAFDQALQSTFAGAGCLAVLRATYLDQLQGVVMTVGIAAFPDARAADRAASALQAGPHLLRALAFSGTASAVFTDAARQTGTAERIGPYVVLTTAGQSDGRTAASVPQARTGVFDPVPQIGHAVARGLVSCPDKAKSC